MTTESLWDYIPGLEKPDQYAAFEFYRDSAPRIRSLADTARACGISYGTLTRWAKENYWADRVASYDLHRNEQRALERVKAEQIADATWAEKRAEVLAKINQISLTALDQLQHDLGQRRGRMRPNEIKQLTELLLRFGNLANGDATEQVANVIDLRNASDEDLAALERLRNLEKDADQDDDGKKDL